MPKTAPYPLTDENRIFSMLKTPLSFHHKVNGFGAVFQHNFLKIFFLQNFISF